MQAVTKRTASRTEPWLARCFVLAGAALLALLLSTAAPAWGHAEVAGFEPGPDVNLDRPPEQVRVWFDEPVELLRGALEVVGEDGIRVDLGDAGHGETPEAVTIGLPDDLPAGTYTARWRIQAADSHPQEGSWTFTVTQEPPEDDQGETGAADGKDANVAPSSTEAPPSADTSGSQSTHDDELAGDLAREAEPDTLLPGAVVLVSLLAGLLVAGLAALVLWRAGELGNTQRS